MPITASDAADSKPQVCIERFAILSQRSACTRSFAVSTACSDSSSCAADGTAINTNTISSLVVRHIIIFG